MTDIIIPIKHLADAKSRLAGELGPKMRAGLVLAMLEDLLTTISRIGHARVSIVTSDMTVVDAMRRFDISWVQEIRARGYNEAALLGISSVGEGGDIAIIPGDIPLAGENEIAGLIAPSDPARQTIRLVPSRDRQGTNGLFMSGNVRLQPGFGPGSFARYCHAARDARIEPAILQAPTMAHDIDTPGDLHDLSVLATTGITGRYLHGMQFASDGNQYKRAAS